MSETSSARSYNLSDCSPNVPPYGRPQALSEKLTTESKRNAEVLRTTPLVAQWVRPPDTRARRQRGRDSGRRTEVMAPTVEEHVRLFSSYLLRQKGRAKEGVETYGWTLRNMINVMVGDLGRTPTVSDLLNDRLVYGWLDRMTNGEISKPLSANTIRTRLATVSSFCDWLAKRGVLPVNPITKVERPPRHRGARPGVPATSLMDSFVAAAIERGKLRDAVLFSLLRYSGMRRGSVVSLRIRNLDDGWGLRDVPMKGGKTRDIPLPKAVNDLLRQYVSRQLPNETDVLTEATPLFWSSYGRRGLGKVRRPMNGKNLWRLCKTYSRILKLPPEQSIWPHAFRHGVAMEVYEQYGDLERVRALLGHQSIETTQAYAQIRPRMLKETVSFYETKAAAALENGRDEVGRV